MSEPRTVTTSVLVVHGGISVPVSRASAEVLVPADEAQWTVGTMSSRFIRNVVGLDVALELAERVARGLDRVRLIREVAQGLEDSLYQDLMGGS